MKTLLLFLFLLISPVQAQTIPEGLTECSGAFALCSASTCTPTGNTITIKGKTYPEAICDCPVLNGDALADIDGGSMEGSCERLSKSQVWSLFAYQHLLPQAMFDWQKAKTKVQECPANLNLADQSVNCFSMSCDITSYSNRTVIASCSCPIGQSVTNQTIPPATTFLIQSGQGDPEYCGKNPVAVTPLK